MTVQSSNPAGNPIEPHPSRDPAPRAVSVGLTLPLLIWTLPQTAAGLLFALLRRRQGHRFELYRFGPFLYLVMPCRGPGVAGISLGLIVFSESRSILKHEFCHLLTGLWLSWLYLPVYGLEYATVGHRRSPHERITNWFEKRLAWGWRRWAETSPDST